MKKPTSFLPAYNSSGKKTLGCICTPVGNQGDFIHKPKPHNGITQHSSSMRYPLGRHLENGRITLHFYFLFYL